jgi:hypothetical protein
LQDNMPIRGTIQLKDKWLIAGNCIKV